MINSLWREDDKASDGRRCAVSSTVFGIFPLQEAGMILQDVFSYMDHLNISVWKHYEKINDEKMDQHLKIENNEMCAKKGRLDLLISTLFAFSFCCWIWECDVKKEGHDILRLSEKNTFVSSLIGNMY